MFHSVVSLLPLPRRYYAWVVILGLGFAIALSLSTVVSAIANSRLTDIQAVAPDVQLEIRYATTQNFVRRKLYSQARCLLRPRVAGRLAQVQTDLKSQGLGLKVYDCYRPLSVQKQLWQMVPDPNYVADPARGSRHNRGSAVDLTLVDGKGKELEMPSQYDEFSARSHLDYTGGSPVSLKHRQILQRAMHRRGFVSLASEWWHFDAPDWQQYPILDVPLDQNFLR